VDLDIRLILPGPGRGTVLLTAAGELPALTAAGDADEASIVAIDRVLRGELGFDEAVLERNAAPT